MAPPAVRHPTLPIGLRELRRRQHFLGHRVGREILDLRTEANVTQTALAAGAGIDQAHLSRIERGLVRPSLDTLVAIAASLGGDVGVKIFPGSGPRILDRFQAPMVDCMIRALRPSFPCPERTESSIWRSARGLVISASRLKRNRSCDRST
jgi:transcriptional regulator with XRE-family HTH domain